MKLDEYQRQAKRFRNPDLTGPVELAVLALGTAGEAGEVADLVKKHIGQGHSLDKAKLIDELGDVLWYVSQLADALGLTLGTVARLNVEKLNARYPQGFQVQRSVER